MQPSEAYELGLERLKDCWQRVADGESASPLPSKITDAISDVVDASAQVSHRYALITQMLLKLVLKAHDGRQLEGFPEVNGPFSGRSFARATVVKFPPVGNRLGASNDPYIGNPLREKRLPDDLLNGKGRDVWRKLFAVIEYVDDNPEMAEAVLLDALAAVKNRPESLPKSKTPPKAQRPEDLSALVEDSSLDQDQMLDIIDVLQSDQPQVILAGPPGTSKTHVALAIAAFLTNGDDSRSRVVQFHASYGYEEFVEGLRPTAADGGIQFEVAPGAVRRMSEGATDDKTRVLVLDEMNRANLPRVLGELLFAVERRDEPVDLLYTEGFRLPRSIAFIGTMNTADRSIRSIDAAVRRRFQIFEFPPRASVLAGFYAEFDNEVDDLVAGFVALNRRLEQLLDRHHTIGHTFFMDARGMTSGRLRQTWERQVRPLVEEYFFDQPDLLREFTPQAFWPSMSGE